jgi:outer membrane protein
MNAKKTFTLLTSILLIVFSLPLVSAAQGAKFGFFNSDKITTNYSEWMSAQEEFESEYTSWDDQAKEMQVELEEMLDEYERQRLILSEDKKREREAAIETKRLALDAFTKRVFGPGGEAEKKNNALIKPLLERINTAIEQLATEGNYDFIFNSSGLAYANKDYDITAKILEILEE